MGSAGKMRIPAPSVGLGIRQIGRRILRCAEVWQVVAEMRLQLGAAGDVGKLIKPPQAVVDAVFTSLPLNRLEAQHDLRNPASGRVMQKCGFRQEGVLRSRILNKGEYVDVALYALIRSDREGGQR